MKARGMFMREINLNRTISESDLRDLCTRENWCDRPEKSCEAELINTIKVSDLSDVDLYHLVDLIMLTTDRYYKKWLKCRAESDCDFAYILSRLCSICQYQVAE